MTTLTTPKYAIPYPDANEPVSGGAAAMQAIGMRLDGLLGAPTLIVDTGELVASAASFDLTSIPQVYRDLRLILFMRSTTTAVSGYLACNGDATAANYEQGGAAGGAAGNALGTVLAAANVPGTSATANSFGVAIVDLMNYRRAGPKVMLVAYGVYRYDGTLTGTRADQRSCFWNGAAINRLTLTVTGQLAIGSRAILLGVAHD